MMQKFFTSSRFLSLSAVAGSRATRRWYADKAGEPKAEKAEGEKPADSAGIDSGKHEQVLQELKEANSRIEELKKDYMYALADADNARRIGREDVEKARNYSVTKFAKDMLEVVDTLDRAIEAFDKCAAVSTDKELTSIRSGVKLSQSVLLKNMSRHGVEKMELKRGDVFNPNFHEALFRGEAAPDCPSEHITAVVKTGYTIKDRVLRAAQVGVAE